MGGLGRDAWAWLGVVAVALLVQHAGASHVVYENHLDLEEEAAAVPPSIVDPQLRPGYHFQPPKNWINGKVNLPNFAVSDEVRTAGCRVLRSRSDESEKQSCRRFCKG